jgi:hypothetical protein
MRPLALILLLAACSPDAAGLQTMTHDAAPYQQVQPTLGTDASGGDQGLRPVVPDAMPGVMSADAGQVATVDTRPSAVTVTVTVTATDTSAITSTATSILTTPDAGPDAVARLPYGTGTNTSWTSYTAMATTTYTETLVATRTWSGTIVQEGGKPVSKTETGTETYTGTKTVTATTTATNGCTDVAPIDDDNRSYQQSCTVFAAKGGCLLGGINKVFCQTTCLKCNAGCKDTLPPASVYAPQVKTQDLDCVGWLLSYTCSDAEYPNHVRYFCRKNCGLCVP